MSYKTTQTLEKDETTGDVVLRETGQKINGTAAAEDISAFDSAGSAQAAQDYSIQRSNHTGTQTLSTISDAGTAASKNTGTGADEVPTTSSADGRYAKLLGSNDFQSMPTVGGDPIVESGSNSDGEWTRWADGTQSATVNSTATEVTSAAGAIYRSVSDAMWTFPMPFLTGAFPAFSGQVSGLTAAWLTAGSLGTTETRTTFRVGWHGVVSAGPSVRLSVLGRWK